MAPRAWDRVAGLVRTGHSSSPVRGTDILRVRGLKGSTVDTAATTALPRRRFIRNAAAGAAVVGSGSLVDAPQRLGRTGRSGPPILSVLRPERPGPPCGAPGKLGTHPAAREPGEQDGTQRVARAAAAPPFDRRLGDGSPHREPLPEPRHEHRTRPITTLGGSWDLMFDLGTRGRSSGRRGATAAPRGDGRLLVQPPQRLEPQRQRLVVAARLRPGRDPQACAREVLEHAGGLRHAPGDDDLPEQRRVHQGQPERELRPRAARAAYGRRGRRLRRDRDAHVRTHHDGVRHLLGHGALRVRRGQPLHGPRQRDGVPQQEQRGRRRATTSGSTTSTTSLTIRRPPRGSRRSSASGS